MTTPNTIVDTMNKAHSHGADAEKAHPSRADRPTSFNLDDIAVPHGREEDWRFTPMRRIERLFEPANYDAGDAPVTVDAPASVVVETVSRDDNRLGTVLAPGDRTAVVAWNGFAQATVVEIPAEAELDAPVRINVADVEGTRAQHLVIRAGAFSKATVILSHTGSAQAALNQTVEVETGDSANLTVVSLQEWDDSVLHASNQRLALGRDSKLTHIVVSFGGDLVRLCADTDSAAPVPSSTCSASTSRTAASTSSTACSLTTHSPSASRASPTRVPCRARTRTRCGLATASSARPPTARTPTS